MARLTDSKNSGSWSRISRLSYFKCYQTSFSVCMHVMHFHLNVNGRIILLNIVSTKAQYTYTHTCALTWKQKQIQTGATSAISNANHIISYKYIQQKVLFANIYFWTCKTQCNYRCIPGGGYQRFSTHTLADAKLFATLMTNGDSCNVFKCSDFPCTIVIPWIVKNLNLFRIAC